MVKIIFLFMTGSDGWWIMIMNNFPLMKLGQENLWQSKVVLSTAQTNFTKKKNCSKQKYNSPTCKSPIISWKHRLKNYETVVLNVKSSTDPHICLAIYSLIIQIKVRTRPITSAVDKSTYKYIFNIFQKQETWNHPFQNHQRASLLDMIDPLKSSKS